MVTGNTATELGDILISQLIQPYQNTVQVTAWSVLLGVSDSFTVGTINVTSGSTTVEGVLTNFELFDSGQEIIIGNITYVINTVHDQTKMSLETPVTATASGINFYKPAAPDTSYAASHEFRWSDNGQIYSEFRPLNNNTGSFDLLGLSLDKTKPFYIDVKTEITAIVPGSSITVLAITYTLQTDEGTLVACPQISIGNTTTSMGGGSSISSMECDPYLFDGIANIRTAPCPETFNPYNLGKASNVYQQLGMIVSDIFGHTCNYFRTEPDTRTEDVILMEYSLHNVVDNKNLKILVPDNEFPTEAATFDIFGMEFDEFEVHIVHDEFMNIFGTNKRPRSKDYLYIPIINKMYEVSSVSIADEFNQTKSYWRVKLTKYQERTSVIKGTYETATDNLVTGIEETMGTEIQEEYTKDTNPTQFQTVSTSFRDGIRTFVATTLKIVDYNLKNRWTIVSKNYYDMSGVDINTAAVKYDALSLLTADKNLGVSLWFRPQSFIGGTDYPLLSDGGTDGFHLSISTTEAKLVVGGPTPISTTWTHGTTLNSDRWYGVILNINNTYSHLRFELYELANSGALSQTGNNLVSKFSNTQAMSAPHVWNNGTSYQIEGGKMHLTNVRIFDTPIDEDQDKNVLNQYVVRDNQLSVIIDNAIPSIGFQKFKNAR
jgi:hypothetical protein